MSNPTGGESKPRARARPLLLVAALCLLSGPLLAEDDDNGSGWFIPKGTAAKNVYAGVGFGINRNDVTDSWQDGSVTSAANDKTDKSANLSLGYQVNDHIAVEGAYRDLGESKLDGTSSGGPSWAAGPISGTQEADGWELGVMGRWPVSERWFLLGFVGVYWWESKETYNESGIISTLEESGSSATYALGFEFDHGLKDRIVYRFMGTHHEVGNDDYNVNGASAQVIYRFP